MKGSVYQWVKNLAVFYIFLTGVINFIPDGKYERYVRYFMGLLLIFMLCAPLLQVLGRTEVFEDSVRNHFKEQLQAAQQTESGGIQEDYLIQSYQAEAEKEMEKKLSEMDVETARIEVTMEEEQEELRILGADIYLKEGITSQKEQEIVYEMERTYGLGQERVRIFTEENDKAAVAGHPASGTPSVGDRASGQR